MNGYFEFLNLTVLYTSAIPLRFTEEHRGSQRVVWKPDFLLINSQ